MPISPENQARYPQEWPQIRAAILARAGHRCEQCGVANYTAIVRLKVDPAVWETFDAMLLSEADPGWDEYHDPVRVVLTISHLNHTPEDNREENLAALCQRCHLVYDQVEHEQSRRRNRDRRAGQGLLMEVPP